MNRRLRYSFFLRLLIGVLGAAALTRGALAVEQSTGESTPPQEAGERMPVETPETLAEARGDWWHSKWAGGDWGGRRAELEKRGLVFQFIYNGEVRTNAAGGINTNDATHYLQDTNASLDFFTDKLLYPGGEFYVRYEGVLGEGISKRDVGDVQLISSIDAPPFNQVSEYFYRHTLLDGKLHFKVGKQDGTGDFLALTYGTDFTHSAYGHISNVPIPSFPNYALGAVVSYDATSWFSFGTGVYDYRSTGKTSGFDTAFEKPFHEFSILELTFKPQIAKDLPTIFRLGTWHERKDITPLGEAAISPVQFRHDLGAYGEFEQLLCGFGSAPEKRDETNETDTYGNKKPERDQGIAIFGQFGWSPDDRNTTPRYFGAGVRAKGFLKSRDADVIGAGIVSVLFAPRLRHLEGRSEESAIEFFYKVQASPFMFFQPDFQYVVKPGGNQRDAVTFGLRYQVAF